MTRPSSAATVWTQSRVSVHRGGVPAVASLVWSFDEPLLTASTASVGGGLGLRSWVLNAQVPAGYARTDTEAHVREIAEALGLPPSSPGVGMLTAADVDRVVRTADGPVRVEATVGLTRPLWAAAPEADALAVAPPGTVNMVVYVPVRHSDAALLNLLCTVSEAKAQALVELGVAGTGTASDAVSIVCPTAGLAEPFGGPRSLHGACVARAVHAAITEGASENR